MITLSHILLVLLAYFLILIASVAKCHMDQIVFRRNGFTIYPDKIREWLLFMTSVSSEKWKDGWHVMQSVWHLTYALGWCILSITLYSIVGLSWWLLPLAVLAWLGRLLMNWLGFLQIYPIK